MTKFENLVQEAIFISPSRSRVEKMAKGYIKDFLEGWDEEIHEMVKLDLEEKHVNFKVSEEELEDLRVRIVNAMYQIINNL